MEQDSLAPMTPPNHFVKELRGVLDQQNILSAKTKQKGKIVTQNLWKVYTKLYYYLSLYYFYSPSGFGSTYK